MFKWLNDKCVAVTVSRETFTKIHIIIRIQDSVMKDSGLRIGDKVAVKLSSCGTALQLLREGTINRPGKGRKIMPLKSGMKANLSKGKHWAGKLTFSLLSEDLQGLTVSSDMPYICLDMIDGGHGNLIIDMLDIFKPLNIGTPNEPVNFQRRGEHLPVLCEDT